MMLLLMKQNQLRQRKSVSLMINVKDGVRKFTMRV